MFSIVDSLIRLVGKVIDHLMDWPFLLFVLLVWLAARFRDQIGSFLDRRGAVPAQELSGKIRKEVDPLAKGVNQLSTQVTDLQFQMRRVEDTQSEDRQMRALNPLKARISVIETNSTAVRAVAWSKLSPASIQITSRSRTSGRPRRILLWRFLIRLRARNQGPESPTGHR